MPFQPGNKFGKGRPKGSGRIQECTKYAEEHGLQKLIELSQGVGCYRRVISQGRVLKIPNDELAFEALKLVLAYGLGKPTEKVDLTFTEPPEPIQFVLAKKSHAPGRGK